MGKHQHGGSHYQLPIEPIDFIMTNKLSFCQGNVIKYVARYDRKGTPRDDLMKAKQYIDFMLEELDRDDSAGDLRGQSADERAAGDSGSSLRGSELSDEERDLRAYLEAQRSPHAEILERVRNRFNGSGGSDSAVQD